MFRPNYTPVSFGAMAGRDVNELFQLKRYTAMQPWHEQAGALFEDVGQWKRPWYYPQAGESLQDAINRECLAVRNGVGILDASTLGKIDIQGPRCARIPEQNLHQRLDEAGRRQMSIRSYVWRGRHGHG